MNDAQLLTPEQQQLARKRVEQVWYNGLKPPEKISVVEWAEKNIVLQEGESPGALRFDKSPYLKEIVNALQDPNVKKITLCFASQSGKTIALFVMLGFIIDQQPGYTLLVYPNVDLAESVAEDRIDPFIESTPVLHNHKLKAKGKYTRLKKVFDTCTVRLIGAGSSSQLKSRPTQNLLLDEIDDYPESTGKETGALELVHDRIKGHRNHKIIQASTPTLSINNIWKEFKKGTQEYFHVPCPHCGEFQKLDFDNLKWPKLKDDEGDWLIEDVRKNTHYECQHCAKSIEDKHKRLMLKNGEWRQEGHSGTHRSFHLNSLYPLWTPFGDVSSKFLESERTGDSLKDFRNGWLGKPWEIDITHQTANQIIAHQGPYQRGQCPVDSPVAVILTVDVQEDNCWFVVRAWFGGETSFLIDSGNVQGLESIVDLSQSVYDGVDGNQIRITHCFIDSGWQSAEVYQFCERNGFIPVKGISNLTQPIKWGKTNCDTALFEIQVDVFKDMLQRKLSFDVVDFTDAKPTRGGWYVYEGIDREYCAQLTAEVPIMSPNKRGKPIKKWMTIRKDNHLFDCEIYSLAIATEMRMRYRPDAKAKPVTEKKKKPKPRQQSYQRADGRDYWDIGIGNFTGA